MEDGTTGTVAESFINVRRPNPGQLPKDGAVVARLPLGAMVSVVRDFGDGWPFIQSGSGADQVSGYIDQTNIDWGKQTPSDPGRSRNGGNAVDLSTALGREAYIYNYWIRKGFKDFQAAAAVGNFMGETGSLEPSILGGFQGLAFGLAQWLGTRKQGVLAFGRVRGLDLMDKSASMEGRILAELDYVWKEFQTLPGEDPPTSPEHPSFVKVTQSTSLEEAANGFAAYERWGGWQQGRAGDLPNHLHYKYADESLVKARNGVYSAAVIGHPPRTKIDIAFGDSLALGINEKIGAAHVQITGDTATALGVQIAKVGIGPFTIEQNITAFVATANSSSFLGGHLVCLSSGASNAGALADIDNLTAQIHLLATAGATVIVLGVAKNGVFPSQRSGSDINAAISQICDNVGARFTGGFIGAGPGNVHPKDYATLVSRVLGAANA
jgi:hypothetical protein